jgi:hypothetical protein
MIEGSTCDLWETVMKRHHHLTVMLIVLLLLLSTGCGTLEVGIERTATPAAADAAPIANLDTGTVLPGTPLPTPAETRPAPTSVLEGGGLETSSPVNSAVSEATPATGPLTTQLPRSLYLLSREPRPENPGGVWRLDPGSPQVERVTPADLDITSFDVALDDGRLAYGTKNGQLYVVLPGGEPRLLYDAGLQADDAVEISSVAWSPDGTHLAYTVRYLSPHPISDGQSPGESDGLWLLSLNDATPVKLLSNQHLDMDTLDVNAVRTVSDPIWSPDGTALLLTGHYWEWIDTHWLDPIAPAADEAHLHDPPGNMWGDGSWSNDSRSILLSGTNYSQFSDLVRVRRDSSDAEQLISGADEGLFIHKAQELPAGIVFLAFRDPQETQLYLGQQTASGFSYAPAGPARHLCSSGYLRDIAWDPAGRLAVLSCDRRLQLVSLDGAVDVDLTPFLEPLSDQGPLKVVWDQS